MAKSSENFYIVRKQMLGKAVRHLLRLNREERFLEVYERVANEMIHEYHSIRDDFDSSEYVMFEKAESFPCIYGSEGKPTPSGIFSVEYKSKDAYISGYHSKYDKVKFFGYLVIFEDYFIHSNMYLPDASEKDMRNGRAKTISSGDEATAGCVRVSQEDLDWLVENIEPGTAVIY